MTEKSLSSRLGLNSKLERSAPKKRKDVCVLVLGQSGSGKSTLLSYLQALSVKLGSEHFETVKTTAGFEQYTMSFPSFHNTRKYESHVFYVFDGVPRSVEILPFHSDAIDAIIFLTPTSCFDEYIPRGQGRQLNCLEYCFCLWESTVSITQWNKIPTILLLNKIDVLEEKMASGGSIKDHVPSYGNRANDCESYVAYLRRKLYARCLAHSQDRAVSLYQAAVVPETAEGIASTIVQAIRNCVTKKRLAATHMIGVGGGSLSVTSMVRRRDLAAGAARMASSSSSSLYSLASSRTQSTDYGHYARRMAYSQETTSVLSEPSEAQDGGDITCIER